MSPATRHAAGTSDLPILRALWYNRVGLQTASTGKVNQVKASIHPKYEKASVTCACGNSFETRSTVGDIRVEICSACHPFFTGKQKIMDREGRVEKFMAKYGMKKQEEQ